MDSNLTVKRVLEFLNHFVAKILIQNLNLIFLELAYDKAHLSINLSFCKPSIKFFSHRAQLCTILRTLKIPTTQ